MSFRLVPNSVTLDDLERRNSPNGGVISPNTVAFGADYLKRVEDTPILSAGEMQAKEFRFQRCIIYGDIGRTPSESVKVRRPALASENLTNNQP